MELTRKEKIALLNKTAKPSNPESKWIKIAEWNEEHADALEDFHIIATRLLNTLKSKKMTQREFAAQLNVSPQALTRIMKGRQNLTINKVRQLERILGVSLMQIKLVEDSQTQIQTKMIPVELHYNYSRSAYTGSVNYLCSLSKNDSTKSVNKLSVAS